MADLLYYSVLFLLWLSSVIILVPIFRKSTKSTTYKNLNLPPSPPTLPLIGNLHLLSRPLYKGLQAMSSQYGPLLYLRLGAFKCLLISSSSVGADIFKTHDLTFSYKVKSPFDDRIVFGDFGFFNAPYGDYWKFMKKLCVTELLGTRQIQRSHKVRREELIRLLKRVLDKAYKKEPISVCAEVTKLTNDTSCMMFMGSRCSKEEGEDNCIELVIQSLEMARKITPAVAFPPLKRVYFWYYGKHAANIVSRFDALTERKLKEHEARTNREESDREDKDIMDVLLEAHHNDKAEVKISRLNIKAFMLDLLVGSTGTSAEVMQWAIAELLNHPNEFKKLRDEIDSVVGKRLVEESDFPNLPYLQAVVKETLRLYPALPVIPRSCPQNCKIGEYDIPKGTAILIHAYNMMRDPSLWEDPNEFKPERFLGSSKEVENKGLNFIYLPFGVGRRMCVGQNLAITMITATVGALVQCFDWKLCDDQPGTRDGKVSTEVRSEFIMDMVHPLTCVPVVHFDPLAT